MRVPSLAVLLLVACSNRPAEPGGLAAAPLLVGRFTREHEPRFAWSGSAITTRFRAGTIAVALEADQAEQHFAVLLDGEWHARFATRAGRHSYPLADGLPVGEHTVSVYRLSEAALGETQLAGFALPEGGTFLPAPAARSRRLLVIGDSITAGYGNEGADQTCSFTPASENHYLAYAALAARGLDAELTSVAWSGKGVFSNRGQGGETMPALWRRILPDEPQGLADDGPIDAIWLNLGTNDFAGENPDWSPFAGEYLAFVRELRARFPAARIFCLLGPMLSDGWPEGRPALPPARQGITAAVAQLQAEGDLGVHFLEFPAQDGSLGYGCDYHPSLATHRAMAERLETAMRATLGW